MTETLFQLGFLTAVPFWALMILAPTWSRTRRIAASPLIVLPTLAVCLVLLIPVLPDVWPVVSNPSLSRLQGLVADPEALTALWVQILAWDLFVGRWVYLDSRERGIHPLVMAPLMVGTILLSPLFVPLYLVVRLLGSPRSRDRRGTRARPSAHRAAAAPGSGNASATA